ncbi:uncharacterized protein N7529_012164 [Penicillium soppii]|uniref:uncharacterized protein n=1 Tax=Penicillium soppii TaxID=69789 RepID=UPI002549B440|nr:uncharacterized protein N7529_012164 [Penicillium soppii]KAJ5852779.1 hypothetical protein N7529_012164 [Penicillium soppii]
MGVSESKLLADHVLQNCLQAETHGQTDLDASILWSTETVEDATKSILKKIPAHLRGHDNRVDRAALRTTPICLPEELRPFLLAWKDHPEGFDSPLIPFQGGGNQNGDVASNPVASKYLFLCTMERDSIVDRVRRRLCYIFFYMVKDHVQGHGPLTNDTILSLSLLIQSTRRVQPDEAMIHRKLRMWIDAGERLWLLSKDLGGFGIVFLLPEDIGENVWQQNLPKSKTARRDRLLCSLRRRGISEEATALDAHSIAMAILKAQFRPLHPSLRPEIQEFSPHEIPAPQSASQLGQHEFVEQQALPVSSKKSVRRTSNNATKRRNDDQRNGVACMNEQNMRNSRKSRRLDPHIEESRSSPPAFNIQHQRVADSHDGSRETTEIIHDEAEAAQHPSILPDETNVYSEPIVDSGSMSYLTTFANKEPHPVSKATFQSQVNAPNRQQESGFYSIRQDVYGAVFSGDMAFDPREDNHPVPMMASLSQPHHLSQQPEPGHQNSQQNVSGASFPDDFGFDPREDIYPVPAIARLDQLNDLNQQPEPSYYSYQQNVLHAMFPDELEFDPREHNYPVPTMAHLGQLEEPSQRPEPALEPDYYGSQQDVLGAIFSDEMRFDPREDIHPNIGHRAQQVHLASMVIDKIHT